MICYVLDTDHLSLYQRLHPKVRERILWMRRNTQDFISTTTVSFEEQLGGRLVQIGKAKKSAELIQAYKNLRETLSLFSELPLLDYDFKADELFGGFRKSGIRIGTLDLRIACIALAHNAVVVTRNTVDFGKVPGLSLEDWSA